MSLIYLVIINAFLMFMPGLQKTSDKDSLQSLRKMVYGYINDKKLTSTKAGRTQVKIFQAILCNTIGEACTKNAKDGDKNHDGSVFGMMTNLITMPLGYPPASGSMWAYKGLENVGFIPKTQAAGIGFYSFHTFQPIWQAFRNVAYTILVLVIVTIGFLIMFRTKINPQTVIGIENALPNIVLTLIFITFSYAIAGFLVDLMYILIFLMFGVFVSSGVKFGVAPASMDSLANSYLVSIGGVGLFKSMAEGFWIYISGLNNLYNVLPDMAKGVLHLANDGLIIYFALAVMRGLSEPIEKLLGRLTATPLVATLNFAAIISIILTLFLGGILAPLLLTILTILLVIIGLLFLYFRIFFLLIGAYIQITLQVILAPLLILPNALPGQNSFWTWLKRLFGYLLVFPLVIFFLLLIKVIFSLSIAVPDYSFSMPLLTGLHTNAFIAIIAAIMLVMIPDLVKTAIKPLIGEGIQLGAGALFAGVGAAGGSIFHNFYQFAIIQPHLKGIFGGAKEKLQGYANRLTGKG